MPAPLTLEWADFDIEPTSGVVPGPTWDDVRSIVEHYQHAASGFIILKREGGAFVQMTWRDADPEEGLQLEWHTPADEHFELDEGFIAIERAVKVFRQFFDAPNGMPGIGAWSPLEF